MKYALSKIIESDTMMRMRKNIFFIGPASVGKSTNAELLAHKLGHKFVDIDEEFCRRVELIPEYVNSKGYPAYCEANSKLTDELINENPEATVFATPSGFLVHGESPHLIEKHLEVIGWGISVLLLPDEDPHKGVEIIVTRQLSRWNDIEPEKERQRFLSRFDKYKNYGDIKIFSMENPEIITDMIIQKLSDVGAQEASS